MKPIPSSKFRLAYSKLFLTFVLFVGFGCANGVDDNTNNPSNGGNNNGGGLIGSWLIPAAEVKDGGPGKDGIPSIDNPTFLAANDALYLSDDDLVVGYKNGDDVRAYSHKILDYHEIVNDVVNGTPVAITYCPLTGSAIGWVPNANNSTTEFGVSGLLYNTNLIPYDRNTDSNWSQMRLECVNGPLAGTKIETFPIVETTWGTWKAMYPETKVLSNFTGFSRNYSIYPYGDYRTNDQNLLFRVNPDDNRLPRKDRVLGVIVNDEARVYEVSKLSDEIKAINDSFNGDDIVVIGSKAKNFLIAFNRELDDGTILDFEALQDNNDVIMTDTEGNTWDVFGEAVSGPRKGIKLRHASSFIGYWMAWGAFYPEAEISQQ